MWEGEGYSWKKLGTHEPWIEMRQSLERERGGEGGTLILSPTSVVTSLTTHYRRITPWNIQHPKPHISLSKHPPFYQRFVLYATPRPRSLLHPSIQLYIYISSSSSYIPFFDSSWIPYSSFTPPFPSPDLSMRLRSRPLHLFSILPSRLYHGFFRQNAEVSWLYRSIGGGASKDSGLSTWTSSLFRACKPRYTPSLSFSSLFFFLCFRFWGVEWMCVVGLQRLSHADNRCRGRPRNIFMDNLNVLSRPLAMVLCWKNLSQ